MTVAIPGPPRQQREKDAELTRLEAILAGMTPADRAIIEARLLPRWMRRRWRLAVRDGLIRKARQLFPGPHTTSARRLELAMIGYQLSDWRWERNA